VTALLAGPQAVHQLLRSSHRQKLAGLTSVIGLSNWVIWGWSFLGDHLGVCRGVVMRFVTVILLFLLLSCALPDQSILTRDGDETLDCAALKAEFDFAAELSENAPARRRHIRELQKEKQCVTLPKISISIGVSKSFN
jgi:hypothetical protein